jgi:spermidine synthase
MLFSLLSLNITIEIMKKKHTVQHREPNSRLHEIVLLIAFFFSGATSLSLEVAWSKELTYLLGVDMYSTTTVVTAFMAGLGLGALLVARSDRWIQASIKTYGLLQLVIGFCALLSIPLFRLTQPLFSFLFNFLGYDSAWFLLVRFLVVFGFMLIPVTLMGMTLPVVVGASYKSVRDTYAYLAGKLYGVNTLGAVLGTLTAGFLLIPTLGILKTCVAAGVVDLIIGCAMLWRVRYEGRREVSVSTPSNSIPYKGKSVQRLPVPEPPATPRIPFVRTFSWPAAVFLLSGISALAYEIIWFRLLARIIGPSVHAFSIMLATYLLGLALGSLMGAGIIKKIRNHRLTMAVLLGAIGFGPLLTLFCINELPLWYGMLFVRFTSSQFTIWNLVLQGVMAGILILPATLPLGAFFPVVTYTYNKEQGNDHVKGSVGHLYFYNTIGGVIGSLVAGFWLVPAVGIKSAILVAAGLNIAMSFAIYFAGIQSTWYKKAVAGCVAAAAFFIFVFASPSMNQTVLNAGLYSEMVKKEYFSRNMIPENRNLGSLLYFQEGINNSVAVVANKFNDGNLTLHLSGSWEASTEIHGRMHLKFLGHLPMLFARETKTVGVIGFGAGITTGTVLLYPDVQQVNVFELESGVINASKYFAFVNNKPLDDPRTRLFMVDGRSHITYGDIQYDVITSDPIHPYVAGAANLYTYNYYQTMADHLNPGGIFCQWIPMVGMSPEAYNTVLNSMHQAFPHLAVFSFCGESVIIASKEPLRADWKTLENRFYDPKVYSDLKMLDVMTPYNLVDFFMGAEAQIDQYLFGITRINTDDNVWLEHRIPMDFLSSSRGNLFSMLRDKIPVDGRISLEQVFFGIPMKNLSGELSALKKDGNNDYKRAQQAYQQNDFESMEKYLRLTLADFNSSSLYAAGTQLMDYLVDSDRMDEIFPVASYLQRNFPAFPEAYIVEARAWEKMGERTQAEQALNRGWIYLPGDPKMVQWRKHFGMTG